MFPLGCFLLLSIRDAAEIAESCPLGSWVEPAVQNGVRDRTHESPGGRGCPREWATSWCRPPPPDEVAWTQLKG
jgi:hypothetical protein